jgi:hypothetical protein
MTNYQVELLIESGDLPDILNPPASIAERDAAVTVMGVERAWR